METRNVTLTLDKAKEFYNSGKNKLYTRTLCSE